MHGDSRTVRYVLIDATLTRIDVSGCFKPDLFYPHEKRLRSPRGVLVNSLVHTKMLQHSKFDIR